MQYYLIGGAIRDLLLGRLPADMDFAFTGKPEEFLALHPGAERVGSSVHVFLWHGYEYMPLKDNSLDADLQARDLTVNAIALSREGILYAHPRAFEDLQQRILRPTSARIFLDDPLRIFRVARFAASFPDFRLAEEMIPLMRSLSSDVLAALPAERVGRELLKALHAKSPGRFLQVLHNARQLSPWFREFENAADIPAGPQPWHNESVLEHTIQVMDDVAGDMEAAWMALCHDIGKTATPADIWPHHYGHEKRGGRLASVLAQRLKLPRRLQLAGVLAAEEHMRAGMFTRIRPGRQRDVLWRVFRAGFHTPFWHVVDADSQKSYSALATSYCKILQQIHLPEEWRNRGNLSAEKLRELHCAALSALRHSQEK